MISNDKAILVLLLGPPIIGWVVSLLWAIIRTIAIVKSLVADRWRGMRRKPPIGQRTEPRP